MMRINKLFGAILIAALATVSCATEYDAGEWDFNSFSISGWVLDQSDCNPLEGIVISLQTLSKDESECRETIECRSGQDGEYSIIPQNWQNGDFYRITVTDTTGVYSGAGLEIRRNDPKVRKLTDQNIFMSAN